MYIYHANAHTKRMVAESKSFVHSVGERGNAQLRVEFSVCTDNTEMGSTIMELMDFIMSYSDLVSKNYDPSLAYLLCNRR